MRYSSLLTSPNFVYARVGPGTAEKANGEIINFAPGVPRLSNRGFLPEEARTNLVPRSQEIGFTPAWNITTLGAAVLPIVTLNAGLAPDGTLTASRLQLNYGSGGLVGDRSLVSAGSIPVTSGSTYTRSIWIKAYDLGNVGKTIRIATDSSTNGVQIVTLTASWQKLVITGVLSTTLANLIIEARGTFTSQTADVLVWGAQLELGAYPTSYIPTGATAVARALDEGYFNTILTPPFTVVAHVPDKMEGTYPAFFSLSTNGVGPVLTVFTVATNANIWLNHTGFSDRLLGSSSVGSKKVALRVEAGSLRGSVNGVLSSVFNDATAVGLNRLHIGYGATPANTYIKSIGVLPYAVSDAQLQAITA